MPVTFSGKGALKVRVISMALHFLAVTFVRGFCRLQFRFTRQEDCSQTDF